MSTALLSRWRDAVEEAVDQSPPPPRSQPRTQVRAAGQELLKRWDEPHRRYHTREHLRRFLDSLDQLTAAPPVTVRLAGWFHDAVYRAHPGADEEASAELAQNVLAALGVSSEIRAEVSRLVRLTAGHRAEPDDRAGALMIDADLAILGAQPCEYARYTDAVRAEYAAWDDDAFQRGRLAVLTDLLNRSTLFCSERARTLWQQQARLNLHQECTALQRALNDRSSSKPTA